MSQRPSPVRSRVLRSLISIVALAGIAGLVSCGSGGSSPHIVSGGGGGGGQVSPPCTLPTAVTTAASTTKGVGQVIPTNFMDLHLGAPTLPWPTVPFGGLRLWDTSTGWADINTSDGVYNWTILDEFANQAQAHGVDLLYNLARTPTWASSGPTDTTCDYNNISGGPGQCHPPIDLNADGTGTDQDWINWVSAVVSRYPGRIKYYEIWNEWNAPLFWVGTPQQLVRMEQDAHCVVEGLNNLPPGASCTANGSVFPNGIGIDPSAQIITPSPVGSATLLNEVSLDMQTYFSSTVGGFGGGSFADVLGFHAYVGTKANSGACPQPEDVNTVVDDLNAVVSPTPQANKPWMSTESGWSQAPAEGFEDPDRQAAFLPRYYLLLDSLGLQRVYWYRWDSNSSTGGSLWTPSGGPTPAAIAYGEVSKWMVGATLTTACAPTSSGSTVWTCGLSRPNGYQALAVWDNSQDCQNGSCTTKPFTIPTNLTYTMYRDIAGNESSVSGPMVPIGAKPILLETAALP